MDLRQAAGNEPPSVVLQQSLYNPFVVSLSNP